MLLLALAGFAGAAVAVPPSVATEEFCRQVDKRLASVSYADCAAGGFQPAPIASVRGRPILYRDFVAAGAGPNARRILLVGGIHGDELTSVSVVFRWLDRLREARWQNVHWRVIPILNPDGLLEQPARRTNANGVDLNRNFPTPDWNEKALHYWQERTRSDPRRYPGRTAMSEPESQFFAAQITGFQPHAVIQVHAPYGLLDYDGPPEPPASFGALRLKLLGVYPGSLGNFAGVNLGLPVVTLELPNAKVMPPVAQHSQIWADMVAWLESNLPEMADPSLYGEVSSFQLPVASQ